MEIKKAKHTGQIDFPLFIALILICAFGLVMLFSASYYYAQTRKGDGLYYFKSQAIYMLLGFVVMFFLMRLDYHKIEKLKLLALIITIVLMGITCFSGEDINGAQRWLKIPGIGVSVQPAEFAKFVMVLYMASFMAHRPEQIKSFKKGIVPMGAILGILGVLTLLQKNLSMLIIIMFTWMIMLYLGGAKLRHLLALIAIAVPLVIWFVSMEKYRLERVKIFLDPWSDPQDTGYQLVQSLYALASGGLFGQGLNFSRQKLLFLTYSESDFIFSIIGEELGFIGCLCVIAAYMFIVYRGIRIAVRCKDRFGSLLAAGIAIVLALQVLVNIGVVTSSIPPTGQTLPFISSGGTSLIVFMSAMAILLNISKNIKTE